MYSSSGLNIAYFDLGLENLTDYCQLILRPLTQQGKQLNLLLHWPWQRHVVSPVLKQKNLWYISVPLMITKLEFPLLFYYFVPSGGLYY